MKIEEEIQQKKFQSPHQKAMINLIFTANRIFAHQNDFLKSYSITAQQFNILRILKGQYPKTISGKNIKSRMLDSNSDVSRLLDRLFYKELIARSTCPNDKRAVDVQITKQGLKLLELIDKESLPIKQLVKLTKEEATVLSDLLDKLRGQL